MIKNGSPFNRSAMYQTEESVFQVIDISMTDLIDGAILRSVECIFDRQVPMSGMALTGIDNSGMRIMPLKVVPIRKNSNLHLEIQRKCAANMQEIPKT